MADRHNGVKSEYNIVKPNEDLLNFKNEVPKDIPKFGKRHIQAICLFLSLSVALTVRAQLSVTIVAMTDIPKVDITDNQNFNDENVSNVAAAVITRLHNDTNNNPNENDSKSITNDISAIDSTVLAVTKTIQALANEDELSNRTATSDAATENTSVRKYGIKTVNMDKASAENIGWSVYRTYSWTKSTQEMVTGSFFVGYTSMQLPMGVIAHRYGGKLPVLVALFANGVLSIITPWAAIIGWWVVCSCRFLQGMTQAAMFPGIQTMIGKWAPVSERGRLTTRIFTGSQFGVIMAFQMAGFLAGNPAFGWPSSFWVSGLMSLACFVLLAVFGAASPAEHPTISEAEKEYIMGHSNEEKYEAKRSTPWKAILTSMPVWAMVATHSGSTFGYIFLLIEMPVYLSKILHVNIKDNGLFSSLPYMAMWATSIIMGWMSDFLINRGYMRVINVRRIANTFGMMACPILMVAFTYANSVPVAITLLVLSVATHAGVQVGFLINQIDLSPNYAGTLMAIANLTGNFVALVAPVLVSVIVTDVENQSQWRILFMITASFMIVSNVIFVVFLKADVQPWNELVHSEDVSQEFQYEKIDKIIYVTPSPCQKRKFSTKSDEDESTV